MSTPALDPYWTDNELDEVWDAAEPPKRPKRRRSPLSHLIRFVLLWGFILGGSQTGLAYYSVRQTISGFDSSAAVANSSLPRFLALSAIGAALAHDLAATSSRANLGSGSRNYLAGLQDQITSGWQSPASIRDIVKARVLDPSLNSNQDLVADHVTRIEIYTPTQIAIDLSDNDLGDTSLRLCMDFIPTRAPLWQIHHIAWQSPKPVC